MKILSPRTIAILSLLLIIASGRTASAQGPAMVRPDYPPPLISLPEARAIIEGAIAYAREANLRMAVVVVDHAGNVVSADRPTAPRCRTSALRKARRLLRRSTGRRRRSSARSTRRGRDRLFRHHEHVPGQNLSRRRWGAARCGQPPCRWGRRSRIARRRRRKSARAGIAAWMKLREKMKK